MDIAGLFISLVFVFDVGLGRFVIDFSHWGSRGAQ